MSLFYILRTVVPIRLRRYIKNKIFLFNRKTIVGVKIHIISIVPSKRVPDNWGTVTFITQNLESSSPGLLGCLDGSITTKVYGETSGHVGHYSTRGRRSFYFYIPHSKSVRFKDEISL